MTTDSNNFHPNKYSIENLLENETEFLNQEEFDRKIALKKLAKNFIETVDELANLLEENDLNYWRSSL